MKSTIKLKSSITLPQEEVAIVNYLKKKLNKKSNVEIVRTGLNLLKKQVDEDIIREKLQEASLLVREVNKKDMEELDSLSFEGLEDED